MFLHVRVHGVLGTLLWRLAPVDVQLTELVCPDQAAARHLRLLLHLHHQYDCTTFDGKCKIDTEERKEEGNERKKRKKEESEKRHRGMDKMARRKK